MIIDLTVRDSVRFTCGRESERASDDDGGTEGGSEGGREAGRVAGGFVRESEATMTHARLP